VLPYIPPGKCIIFCNVQTVSIFHLQYLILAIILCSLANVDPIDVARNITGLNPETTLGKCFICFIMIIFSFSFFPLSAAICSELVFLAIYIFFLSNYAVVVVSKTFTTAETMLNARTLREWISAALGLTFSSMHS